MLSLPADFIRLFENFYRPSTSTVFNVRAENNNNISVGMGAGGASDGEKSREQLLEERREDIDDLAKRLRRTFVKSRAEAFATKLVDLKMKSDGAIKRRLVNDQLAAQLMLTEDDVEEFKEYLGM